jgi:hypothetical protein
MSKDKRWINTPKTVHRELLKEQGKVHLPPNKVEQTKKAYKKPKYNNFLEEED